MKNLLLSMVLIVAHEASATPVNLLCKGYFIGYATSSPVIIRMNRSFPFIDPHVEVSLNGFDWHDWCAEGALSIQGEIASCKKTSRVTVATTIGEAKAYIDSIYRDKRLKDQLTVWFLLVKHKDKPAKINSKKIAPLQKIFQEVYTISFETGGVVWGFEGLGPNQRIEYRQDDWLVSDGREAFYRDDCDFF